MPQEFHVKYISIEELWRLAFRFWNETNPMYAHGLEHRRLRRAHDRLGLVLEEIRLRGDQLRLKGLEEE